MLICLGPASTAGEHRTRLPVATPQSIRHRRADMGSATNGSFLNISTSQHTPGIRHVLGPLNSNIPGNPAPFGYGLSAGVKAGRMPGGRSVPGGVKRSVQQSIL